MKYREVTSIVWDAVVYGGTTAAFAAALRLRQSLSRVLLVSRHTALVREVSWSFLQNASAGASPLWSELKNFLSSRNAWSQGRLDGACTEVLAAEYAAAHGVEFLFYTAPFAWEEDDGMIGRVGFWNKTGQSWLGARRWIDASSSGEMARLWNPSVGLPKASSYEKSLFFRHPKNVDLESRSFDSPVAGIGPVEFSGSLWKNESVIRWRQDCASNPAATLSLLAFARENLPLEEAVVSHGSFAPLILSEETEGWPETPCNGLWCLPAPVNNPDFGTFFDQGVLAAEHILTKPAGHGQSGHPVISTYSTLQSDVVVTGLGTGGSLAALSAARAGVKTLAIDLMPLPGGVGTGGGIHLYYFGVEGGLQREIDVRISESLHLFGKRKNIAGFHPLAKSLVIEQLLAENKIDFLRESLLGPADSLIDGNLRSVLVSSPDGIYRLEGEAWVDGTGDGDLAVRAGASFQKSARLDGQPSAFSQASGRFRWREGELFLRILNFDAGFVDATDTEDLTRARQSGLKNYRSKHYTEEEHPTYIAPLLGVRQSRHVETHYQVTLADLATRRKFPDVVGYTACHFDSHAIDFEFESEESAFWIWGCRNWRTRLACEIPYRSLVPKRLHNLFLGCRAVGATADAHQSFRMQRDMQRVGEVAGYAAAFCARFGAPALEVPLAWLQEHLRKSGADRPGLNANTGFGYHVEVESFLTPTADTTALVEKTRRDFGTHMFDLYLMGESIIPLLRPLLNESDSSWRAAVVLSMLGDSQAEKRLVEAIEDLEVGYLPDDLKHPEICQRQAPNWLAALTFLRKCATPALLPALANLVDNRSLVHNARTAVALLCQALANRCDLSPEQKSHVTKILQTLLATEAPNAIGNPQRTTTGIRRKITTDDIWYPEVIEDFTWQLHFAVARAFVALGQSPHPRAWTYLNDHRSGVRKLFANLLEHWTAESSSYHLTTQPLP